MKNTVLGSLLSDAGMHRHFQEQQVLENARDSKITFSDRSVEKAMDGFFITLLTFELSGPQRQAARNRQ